MLQEVMLQVSDNSFSLSYFNYFSIACRATEDDADAIDGVIERGQYMELVKRLVKKYATVHFEQNKKSNSSHDDGSGDASRQLTTAVKKMVEENKERVKAGLASVTKELEEL